jgi:hypothetical protein
MLTFKITGLLKSKYLFGVMFGVFGLLAFIISYSPSVHALTLSSANYSNYIIDDYTFTDTSTMSQSSIQAFLQSMGSGLANFSDVENCGSTSGAHYSYYASYYSCGSTQLASQIIYSASQAYGINPQVLLATMQKEQSLITTPNPTSSQLNYAMGYGCPDSGGCSYPGFFDQVDNAAWQFRADIELGSGNNYWGYTPSQYVCNGATQYYSAALKAGQNVTFYDGNGTAYNNFNIQNMSTAALYCYTPHVYNNPSGLYGLPVYGSTGEYYSGSYNFAYYFTLWFSSTYAYDTTTPHPNGTLVTSADGKVYLVNNNQLDWITNGDVFDSYGYQWSQIVAATSGDMSLPAGPNIDTFAPGTLFYSNNTPLYIMTYQSGSLVKQAISLSAYNSLGYNWSQAMDVPAGEIPTATASSTLFTAEHPAGTLVVDNSTGKVYLLNNGSKSWILGPSAFQTNTTFNWADVLPATALDLSLPDGTPVGLRPGAMVYSNGGIYLINSDTSGLYYQPVGPWECFANRLHYTMNLTTSIPSSELPNRSGSLFTCS